jgi:hypothetical protein
MHIYQLIPRHQDLYAVCDRERSEKTPKATIWSGMKNGKSSKEIGVSWYQSIDKMRFQVYVKFKVGLPIPITRKMASKKVRLFPRRFFFQMAGVENKNHEQIWKCELFDVLFFFFFFFKRVAYFSKPRWTTHRHF